MLDKKALLNLSFLEARGKLLEVAAFLDRLDRAEGESDERLRLLKEALPLLQSAEGGRAQKLLEFLSDKSLEPKEKSPGTAAWGVPQNTQASS